MSTASESHSPARGNGLSGVLSKARRARNRKTADTSSLASNGSDGSYANRGKLDGSVDKLKIQDGSDDDDDESGRLSKLIPKGIGSMRRRKKEEREAEIRASEEAARGRSVADRGTLENENGGYPTTADGDRSSLITYESENEEYVVLYFLYIPIASSLLRYDKLADCLMIRAVLRSAIQKRDSPDLLQRQTLPQIVNGFTSQIHQESEAQIAVSLGGLARLVLICCITPRYIAFILRGCTRVLCNLLLSSNISS